MNERKLWLDVLRSFSAVAVVFLHVNGVFWSRPSGITWVSANVIESFFYFAVPCFFMITGLTLLGYRERYSTITFFKRRFSRVLVPYAFWSLTVVVFNSMLNGTFPHGVVRRLVVSLLNADALSVYWFFIPLFSVYLAIPILSLLIWHRQLLWAYLMIAFILYGVLPFVFGLLGHRFAIQGMTLVFSAYVFIAVLGYMIGTAEISKYMRIVIYIVGGGAFVSHYFITDVLSPAGGEVTKLAKGYANWPSILQSVAVFVWVRHASWDWIKRSKILMKILSQMKETSFGVYLTHGILVYTIIPILLRRCGCEDLSSTIGYRTLGAMMIYVIVVISVKAFMKVPVVGKCC